MPQFSVTLAACLLFILGAFKSAAITPPVCLKIAMMAQNIYIDGLEVVDGEDEDDFGDGDFKSLTPQDLYDDGVFSPLQFGHDMDVT